MNDENSLEKADSPEAPQCKEKQTNDKPSTPEPNKLKQQLQESFKKICDRSDKFSQEFDLKREAENLVMDVEEYRRWYELSSESSLWGPRFCRWAGFGGKKLWDFLPIIIVPLAVGLGTWYLQDNAKQREQFLSNDRNRQESLNKYFDTMTNLLLENKLKTSKKDAEIRTIVRAKTLTTLDGLDGYRKWQLLRFLKEAQLIRDGEVIVSLSRANLLGAENIKADLSRTDLSQAILSDADLRNADFSDANLTHTFLTKANLEEANFENTKLKNALLNKANLKKANFRGANLDEANFKDADLSGAKHLSEKQKEQAKFCNTIMPDGKPEDRDCAKLKKINPYDIYLEPG
jgi:uncharacterized protein YjbI with pentapeptide repeats